MYAQVKEAAKGHEDVWNMMRDKLAKLVEKYQKKGEETGSALKARLMASLEDSDDSGSDDSVGGARERQKVAGFIQKLRGMAPAEKKAARQEEALKRSQGEQHPAATKRRRREEEAAAAEAEKRRRDAQAAKAARRGGAARSSAPAGGAAASSSAARGALLETPARRTGQRKNKTPTLASVSEKPEQSADSEEEERPPHSRRHRRACPASSQRDPAAPSRCPPCLGFFVRVRVYRAPVHRAPAAVYGNGGAMHSSS